MVGGGAWGTALCFPLAARGQRIRLWVREADLLSRMIDRRDNPVHLPGVRIPDAVVPVGEIGRALDGADLVLVAVPSPFARGVYEQLSVSLPPRVPVVVTTKGIEEGTLLLPTQVAAEVLGPDWPQVVLSGPSFAPEVARGLPTAIVAASIAPGLAVRVQEVLSGGSLRVYTNADPLGVQVAGALKNVVAIAAGVAHELGMGHNTIAALITRGLAEMRRLGQALGGRASTFSGLAGMGDLVLTCTGELSRNRRVGTALARGERLKDVLSHMASVAEGVRTTRSARDLAHRNGVEMPIVEEVYGLLYEDRSPREAVVRLMSRPLTSEESDAMEKSE